MNFVLEDVVKLEEVEDWSDFQIKWMGSVR